MSSSDKAMTIKTMLEVKGISKTLDFLANTNLNLSKEFLESVSK